MKNKNCLLVDANNIYSKYYYANPEKCIEFLITFLKRNIYWFKTDYVLCVFDAEKSFRKDIYSLYKSNRAPKPEAYIEQLKNFKEQLQKNYIHQISSKTLEAEDSIGLLIKKYEDINFYVLSEDKDCLQLYQYKNSFVFKKFGEKLDVPKYCEISETDESFIEKYKLFFSINGDTSDNIPGIIGLGPKKSNFIVNKITSYENLKKLLSSSSLELECEKLKTNTDKYNIYKCLSLIKDNLEMLEISYKLFSLFETTISLNIDITKFTVSLY